MNWNKEITETKKAMEGKLPREKNWALQTWLTYCLLEQKREKK